MSELIGAIVARTGQGIHALFAQHWKPVFAGARMLSYLKLIFEAVFFHA